MKSGSLAVSVALTIYISKVVSSMDLASKLVPWSRDTLLSIKSKLQSPIFRTVAQQSKSLNYQYLSMSFRY